MFYMNVKLDIIPDSNVAYSNFSWTMEKECKGADRIDSNGQPI